MTVLDSREIRLIEAAALPELHLTRLRPCDIGATCEDVDMRAGPSIELRTEKAVRRTLSELVMAWAHDADTGEPRYILELDADHRGARCACTCVGCGEPLIAVNAAKTEFIKRPHFRHIEGVERAQCLVLAARAAAIRQLQETGWLDLPRRRISGQVEGLSGAFYEAWVERAPEKLRIMDVDYRDRAAAIFRFEDGRTLRVELIGSAAVCPDASQDPALRGAIVITVDEPEIAGMDPQEVRQRLRLVPDTLCWRAHWSDGDLLQEAQDQARAQACLHLDAEPEDLQLPEDMDPALKRETILHHEAKRILVDEGRVAVPAFVVEVAMRPGDEVLRASWALDADVLKLDHIEVEQPYGDIVPDLACKAYPEAGGGEYVPAFIEITVSNVIDAERLARIRAKKKLALEIDLSRAGGRVTRDELRQLVVDELVTKRWLFHPEVEQQRVTLLEQLQSQAQRRASVLATPVSEIAREYLAALIANLKEDKAREAGGEAVALCVGTASDEKLAEAIENLALHGFPEAGASRLIAAHGILDRILSIQHDEGIGYRLPTGRAVLNAIKQDRSEDRAYHSFYFIAALTYKPKLDEEQRVWFNEWRGAVRASIRAGELTFLRPRIFDRLLSVLFPEMADDLTKEGAKRDTQKHSRACSALHETYDRDPAIVSQQPRSDAAPWPLQDTQPADWWLKGRDLERWMRQNPQSAAYWSADTPPPDAKESTSASLAASRDKRDGRHRG